VEDIRFALVKKDDKRLQIFLDLWLLYMREIGDERNDDKILGHANKIIEIQEQKQAEHKVYNIELCTRNENIIGFCFYCIAEISYQKDTEYGLIIKPLVNYDDYGYILEYYINPKYRSQGYGKIMFNHIKERFIECNIKKIVLTPNQNTTAKYFWEKIGFKNSGKIDPTNDLPIFINDI
jgi:ribosomal protein S18 acetylase RimI-like enzyme